MRTCCSAARARGGALCAVRHAAAAPHTPTSRLLPPCAFACSRALEAQRLRLLCLGRVPYSPDEPLHFEAWHLVCLGLTGMGAIEEHPSEALSATPPWQVLGCSAANPAASLGDGGVLALLHLLLLLDYASQLAAQLLEAAQGSGPWQSSGPWAAAGSPLRLPPFSLVEVAAAATCWMLRVAAAGALNSEARRLGSLTIAAGQWAGGAGLQAPPAGTRAPWLHGWAPQHPTLPAAPAAAELFWLGALSCFLDGWHAAAGAQQQGAVDPQRLLLAQLVQAEQAACSNVEATIARHCRHAP